MIEHTEFGTTGSITDLPAWDKSPEAAIAIALADRLSKRKTKEETAGWDVIEAEADGTVYLPRPSHLQALMHDTYGFAIGPDDEAQIKQAVDADAMLHAREHFAFMRPDGSIVCDTELNHQRNLGNLFGKDGVLKVIKVRVSVV